MFHHALLSQKPYPVRDIMVVISPNTGACSDPTLHTISLALTSTIHFGVHFSLAGRFQVIIPLQH